MKKVLLIGGEGFIGSRFVELSAEMFSCTTWDIKSDQNINLDIPRETINRIGYQPSQFDTVIYLSAKPNLASVLLQPTEAYRTATKGLHRALREYKNSHFVYISSSMVYGNWTKQSMSENDLCSPNNIYGTLKLLSEQIVKQFHNNFTIVRPSAVYGYGDNHKRLTQLFRNKIINNIPVVLKGADNLFDFTHVDDVVQGLQHICNKGPDKETYNITRGEAHTLRSFTDMLYQKLNKESNYTIEPVPENYPIRGSLDITKAKKHLQYNPIYSLDEGLDDTINKY
tara:strand:- start:4317 stop:5165 length:849 start_codon:yes stop_codon:yes gene_type:complete